MKVITLANLKGGSAKTTSTAHLAHAYAAQGKSVLVIDADPQGSSLRWSEQGEWDIPTIALPVKNLHTRLVGIVSPTTDVVLIDTPPLDEHAGIVYSALRAADTIIITMAPTMLEFERLPHVWAVIDEVESLRDNLPNVAVLLNRTITNANSTPMFRDLITDSGHIVLTKAFAAPVTDLGKYADAALEIDQLGETK